MGNKHAVLVNFITPLLKEASRHTRILYPHIDHNTKFTDKENYSYWMGRKSVINELLQELRSN